MGKTCSVSYYLDTRRRKGNGLFPVKLRVYSPLHNKAKQFSTRFEFNQKEFQSVWESKKPRTEHKELRKKMNALLHKAVDSADKLKAFSFREFEKVFLRKNGDDSSVIFHYQTVIENLKLNNRFGSASSYQLSLRSLLDFIYYKNLKSETSLFFEDISPDWLNQYEQYMLHVKQRSKTTIGIYLRSLRAVFNSAIQEGVIELSLYPFGKKKYQIPAGRNIKKALTQSELKILFNAQANTPEQARARAFWFFSFACNGMNMKDIALLRFENIQNERIVFYRAKTINTTKTDLTPIVTFITPFVQGVIDMYGNKQDSPKQFVFPILHDSQTFKEQFLKVKHFTKFVNQNIKKLAQLNDLSNEISTTWARHSFATAAIRDGKSTEFVSEALNHKNLTTTKNYIAGFEDGVKRQFAEKMMSF